MSYFVLCVRHVVKIEEGEPLAIGLTITVGAIPAVFFLIFAERIVDYCGHSNILIFCFVTYICHHLGKISAQGVVLIMIANYFSSTYAY